MAALSEEQSIIRDQARAWVAEKAPVQAFRTMRDTGEAQQRTEWHRIVAFGKLAEIASKYLKKGSQAYFEGRIQTSKWQDKDGNDRYSTEIVANQMEMLDRPPDNRDSD